jgi:tetratricopeptide (TPR) repeat protein
VDAFQAASELLAGGRDDLAEPLIRRGLAAEPDHPFGHALMALCHLRRDELDAAHRESQEAARLGPDIPFCHYVLGMVLLGAKKVVEAETAARAALDLDPEDESYLGLLGRIRMAQKRPDEALALSEQGLRVDPNDLNCLNLRIDALRRLGRNAEAQLAVRDILERHPEDEVSHIQAGIARTRVLDGDGARAHFGEALRIDPTNQSVAGAFESGGGPADGSRSCCSAPSSGSSAASFPGPIRPSRAAACGG